MTDRGSGPAHVCGRFTNPIKPLLPVSAAPAEDVRSAGAGRPSLGAGLSLQRFDERRRVWMAGLVFCQLSVPMVIALERVAHRCNRKLGSHMGESNAKC